MLLPYRYLLLATLLGTTIAMMAQPGLPRYDFPISDDNDLPLTHPLVGGLDNPQYSTADLDNDGHGDLVIFDRADGSVLPFLHSGVPGSVAYTYAPQYKVNFPEVLEHWMLLRDYNGDGAVDIFAYSIVPGVAGISVWRGRYEGDELAFEQVSFPAFQHDILFVEQPGPDINLYVSSIDIPAIDDIDGDGDLDVLTFNLGGGVMEWYSNQSVERGYGADSLIFELAEDCWGYFFESGITPAVELTNTPGQCATDNLWDPGEGTPVETESVVHAGSTTLTYDADGDGVLDVVLGDVSFDMLTGLTNGGTATDALITAQSVGFPSNTVAVSVDLFPAAFYLDIDGDGVRDLMAAPNESGLSENYTVSWYYRNDGADDAPTFEYVTDVFLVEDMVDLGSGAAPAFADVNGDGLTDIVVGAVGFYDNSGSYDGRLYLYTNVGTATDPAYTLTHPDWLSFSGFTTTGWVPAFGDLDGDGDLDFVAGEEQGRLYYAENIAPPGGPMQFGATVAAYAGIDVGQHSAPAIVDVDADGLGDLIVGERNGNVNYLPNQGTVGSPAFDSDLSQAPNTESFGSIDVRAPFAPTGFSVPRPVWAQPPSGSGPNALPELAGFVVGSQSGQVYYFDFSVDSIYTAFDMADDDYGHFREGQRIAPALADLDADGFYNIVLGTQRGGLVSFESDVATSTVSLSPTPTALLTLEVAPNPARSQVRLTLPEHMHGATLVWYDALGQVVLRRTAPANATTVAVHELPRGVYFVRATHEGRVATAKVVLH